MNFRNIILLIFLSIVSCNQSKSDWENLIIDNSFDGGIFFRMREIKVAGQLKMMYLSLMLK